MMPKAKLLKLKLRGYRVVAATDGFQTTRNVNRRGCAIFVDLFLNVVPLKERTVDQVEMVGVKIVGDTEKTFKDSFELWTAYSGPNKKDALKCKQMLLKLCKDRRNRLLLAGDLNSDIAPGGSEVCKAVREVLEKLEEDGKASILNDYGEKTTPNGTILDLAVTMGNWNAGFAFPIEWDLGSTHYPVCIGICTEETKTQNQYEAIPRYTRNDQSAAKITKKCQQILKDIEQHTGNSLAQAIIDSISESATSSSTFKKKKRRQNHWWNEEIEALFLHKQNHLASFGKDDQFQQIDKLLISAISKAKNSSFQEFASSLDHCNRNSDVFKAMRNVGSRRASRIAELAVVGIDGVIVTNTKEKANLLSRRYQVPLGHHPQRNPARKKTLKQNRKQREEVNPKGTNHELFTTSEARIARQDMANNKAPGPSRIRKEDLEMGGEQMDALVAALADIIAISGDWPNMLKKPIICPLPKEEEVVDMIEEDKTRPISLLEALDKWLERIFYNRIIKYVSFDETQAGYCLSCDHHTSLVTDFTLDRDKNDYVIAVFTDISKAFDSVPLDELVEAIWDSSIPTAYKWVISSFVEERQFRVEIRDANGNVTASKWRKMLYGTPQGSVFGPLLWNLFFDPLLQKLGEMKKDVDKQVEEENTNAGMIKELENLDTAFADDLTMMAAAQDPRRAEQLLEMKLEIFSRFLAERGMEAAAKKMKVMSLDRQKRGYVPQVHFNGTALEVVDEHKFLGIYYDKHMSFEKHWEIVTTSVANRIKVMAMLRGASWGPTQQTMKVLHQCYIESRIRYGMPAWYPFLSKKYKDKLEKYVLRSVRIVMGLPIHCWNEALMAEADLDSVEEMSLKSAVSLHTRINPTEQTQMTLVKRSYQNKEPKWASQLSKVPKNIWEGPVQTKFNKRLLIATERSTIDEKTVETQRQAEAIENSFNRILYTDASVERLSNPQGKAAIGYIWYERKQMVWEETSRGSATIGSGHSSYSAEAIAIIEGLKNDPKLTEPEPEEVVGIFTDSLSNLSTIKKGVAETPEQEALLRTITSYPNKTAFHHVRSHQDNKKNNDVDELCNIKSKQPGRRNADQHGGKKTAAKIREWMKDWVRKNRLSRVATDRRAIKRGSQTQRWINKILTDINGKIIPPPRMHRHLPRKKGVLMAKARTNRWTQCRWYLHFIKKVSSPLCTLCKVADTTEHVLDVCALHEESREIMLQGLHHTGKVSDMLGSNHRRTVEKLAEFLERAEEKRNSIEKKEREEDQQ